MSDNYPIGVKQKTIMTAHCTHVETFTEDDQTSRWRDELSSGNFLIRSHVQQNFHSCAITATFDKQRILKAKETCENQFDNNKANSLFPAGRNLLQRCERKMKVASQKDDKNKLIPLRSIVFQLY